MLSDLSAKSGTRFKETVDESVIIKYVNLLCDMFLSLNTTFYGWLLFTGSFVQMVLHLFGVRVFSDSPMALLVYAIIMAVSVLAIRSNIIISAFFNKSTLRRFIEACYGEKLHDVQILAKAKEFTRLRSLLFGAPIGIALSIATVLIPKIYILLLLFGFIGIVLVLRNYVYGVYALCFVTPIIPTMLCVGLVIFTYIAFFLQCLYKGKPFVKISGSGFAILLLMLVYAFYGITSYSPLGSLRIALILIAFMSVYYLMINAASNDFKLFWCFALFATSGALVSAYGVYQNFFGTDIGGAWIDKDMFYEATNRVYSTLGNPNVLGEYLLLLIPIVTAIMWTRKGILSKIFFFGILCIATLCMLFTQSRGCWLGLMLFAFIYVVFVNRRLIPYGILFVLILPFFLPDSIMNRFLSIGNLSDTSTSFRVFIWLGTLNLLKDFGLYGIGLGEPAFGLIYPFYSYSRVFAPHSHNLYLQLLTETGIAGLIIFAWLILGVARKSIKAYFTQPKSFAGIMSIALLAGIAGFLLQGAFDYVFYNYRVFLMFFMIIGMTVATCRRAVNSSN